MALSLELKETIDPGRAVKAIASAYGQAANMVALHWQPTIEQLDDQGASHRAELKTLVAVIGGAGVDITPLTEAWRENWEKYQRNGGSLEFVPIRPAIREL